jgi:tetratricopeptide (TPR) repeat protein
VLINNLVPQEILPSSLLSLVLQKSEGNPYFIEEFIRMLIARGYLRQTDDGWSVDSQQDISELPVPSSLEKLIRSRIDALPTDLKGLLQEASVIGSTFDIDLLDSISGSSNTSDGITRLASRLLVHRTPEDNLWNFSHHMIETVSYSSMLKARRKVLHLQVARALEKQWAGSEELHAEELAYHYTRANHDIKAITYLVIAGEKAISRFANEEAASYFLQAAGLFDIKSNASEGLRWRIATGLGDAYRALGRHAESLAVLNEEVAVVISSDLEDDFLATLYRRLGETYQKQGEMTIAREYFERGLNLIGSDTEPEIQIEKARCMIGIAWSYLLQGQSSQAQQSCQTALETATDAGTLADLATSENLMGGIYYQQSDWKPALHHTTRAMVLREQMGYTWGVASTLGNLGILAVSAGQWNKAWSFFERSLTLQQEIGNIEGLAIAHNNLGSLARDQGKLNLAEHHFRESLNVATPFNMVYHIANSSLGLAHTLLLMGLTALAEETLTTSLAKAQEIGAESLLAEIHKVQTEIFLAKPDLEKAKSTIRNATILAARLDNRSLEAACWRVTSEIEVKCGNHIAALKAIANSREAISSKTNELENARIAAQAGQIYIFEGQIDKAEDELESAREIFIRLGADLDRERTEKLLQQAKVTNPRMLTQL